MVLLKKPQHLIPGDTIRIVASSSPFETEAFEAGLALLHSWGFKTKFQKNIFEREPYLAGSDKRRAKELISALHDDSAKAILFARGGYGAMRLLPLLDKIKIKSKPKIILGYSDITCLLNYIQKRLGWITFYGPVVAKDLSLATDGHTKNSFYECLTSTKNIAPMVFDEAQSIRTGKATAPMVGGCLSLIVSQLGTPYDLNTDNRILFLEDVNEKPYQIDRMLTHLKLAGKFKKCRGLVFGSLAGPNPSDHYRQTIQSVLEDCRFPILSNISAGHTKIKTTLPLGLKIKLDAKAKSITYLEAALK